MNEVKLIKKVIKVGGSSLGVTIPSYFAEVNNIKEGDKIEVIFKVIKKEKNEKTKEVV